jgi:hypothetical protein
MIEKKKKKDIVQEYAYIEEAPPLERHIEEDKKDSKDNERGVVIIEMI